MAFSVHDMCKKTGISMLELADRSGLDLLRVRAIYMGRWTPSPKERQKIAEIFECSVDELAWGHETPIQHIYGHGPG